MKKTLIASAVAAATFSGAALAQDTMSASEMAAKMNSLPEVYGNIQLTTVYTDYDGAGSEFSGIADNGSTLGVKHSHELMPGVEGFFKAELEFDADNKAGNGGLNSFDEAYIGVKGDNFGQIWVGSDDSTYESAIDEIANYYEVATQSIGGVYDTGEGDLIQYKSPSFGGLTFGGAVQVTGDGDVGGKAYPYQLAAMYEMGGLELAVAMDSNDGNLAYSQDGLDTSVSPAVLDGGELSVNNENTYGVRASYNLDNLRVTGQFQTRKDVGDLYGLFGAYTLASNTFAASWEHASPDAGDDADVFTVQALHSLSDHMYVYVEGYLGQYGDDAFGPGASDQTDVAVGGTYYF